MRILDRRPLPRAELSVPIFGLGCAQLGGLFRAYLIDVVGADWWRSPKTGEILRDLFAEGTKPSSEEIAARLGFEPHDTAPLVVEVTS